MTIATGETLASRPRPRGKLVAALLILAGASGFVAANAHFVYVSVMSQPDCVAHIKTAGSGAEGTAYRAAKSSC
jgi:hypothetical protein